MTPRSNEYSKLAITYDQIRRRLETQGRDVMSDSEARRVTSHLHRAEVLHHTIEGERWQEPSSYGTEFWQKDPQGVGERIWRKSRVQPKPRRAEVESYQRDQQQALEQRRLREERRMETEKYGHTPVKYLSGWEQIMRGDYK